MRVLKYCRMQEPHRDFSIFIILSLKYFESLSCKLFQQDKMAKITCHVFLEEVLLCENQLSRLTETTFFFPNSFFIFSNPTISVCFSSIKTSCQLSILLEVTFILCSTILAIKALRKILLSSYFSFCVSKNKSQGGVSFIFQNNPFLEQKKNMENLIPQNLMF